MAVKRNRQGEKWSAIAQIAGRQHGVVSRDQLRAADLTEAEIQQGIGADGSTRSSDRRSLSVILARIVPIDSPPLCSPVATAASSRMEPLRRFSAYGVSGLPTSK
jgi:hypothetical protein